MRPSKSTPVEKSAFVVAVILIVLICLALWQFYSLAWADVVRSSYAIGSDGSVSLAASQ
jgi:hypothetical protein